MYDSLVPVPGNENDPSMLDDPAFDEFHSEKDTNEPPKKQKMNRIDVGLQISLSYKVIANVIGEVLDEFNISTKTVCVTTDNGSNFLKAFRWVLSL